MKAILVVITILVGGAFLTADLVRAQSRERSGEEIVKSQCIKCHGTGVHGAPRIDDRAAWAPRMSRGLQATVSSAIHGHGKMPARGGLAELSDTELRAAILYMFYPGAGAGAATASAPAPAPDPRRKLADGMEIFLGVMPAGTGAYHINISLRDAATRAAIPDAVVEARVANALGGSTKKLALKAFDGGTSYVNDFRMTGKDAYTISVQVRRPGAPDVTEVRFDFKP